MLALSIAVYWMDLKEARNMVIVELKVNEIDLLTRRLLTLE